MTRGEQVEGRRKRRVPAWLEFLLLTGLALGLALVVKTFFVQMFFVPSQSMAPLLAIDDKLLVERVSQWGDGSVERGDVVVFRDPGGWLGPPPPLGPVQKGLSAVGLYPSGGHLVKRVVAVGGDRVACCDDEGGGTIPESAVVGKVWAVVWPLSRWDQLESPDAYAELDPPS